MSDDNGVTKQGMDYEAIVAAVLETPRGRWFLHEHERRIRASETRTLLAAVARLEESLAPALGAREANDQRLEGLAFLLQETRSGMAEVGHPKLEDGGAIPSGADAFEFMATSAKAVADDVSHAAEALQSTSLSLRIAGDVAAESAALEHEAARLLTVAYRQEVLSRRVARAAGALTHLDQRLKGHLPKPGLPPVAAPRPLSADHLKYFKNEEEMFALPPLALPSLARSPAAAPEAGALGQVVVIRKASGEIPFLDEDASATSG
ncbi:MAG: hypothetical protein M3N38_03810 [Pseudomonadota bacterium]|nr:hypothetical protein [Pseudomonadota bacterium]